MYKAMIKKSKNKKGFTLVELIVVMAILAILAAILIPSVSGMIRRSNEAVDLASARNIYMAGQMVGASGEDVTINGSPTTTLDATDSGQKIVIDFLGSDWPKSKSTDGFFNLKVTQSTTTGNPFTIEVTMDGIEYDPDSAKFSE